MYKAWLQNIIGIWILFFQTFFIMWILNVKTKTDKSCVTETGILCG